MIALAWALVGLLGAGSLSEAAAVLPSPSHPVVAYDEIILLPDPHGRVVAAAIRFPVGSAQDPIGAEGTAFLFGRWLETTGGESLRRHGARIQVEVRAQELLVTILSSPTWWREAIREVESLLYERSPASAEVDAVRESVLDILRFEEGAPVRFFEGERAALVLGITHEATRPVQGRSQAVAVLGSAELSAFRRDHLSRARAVVAISGPIEAEELEGVLGTVVRTLRAPEEAAPSRMPSETGVIPGGATSPEGGRPVGDPGPAPPIPRAPVMRTLGTDAPSLRVPTGAGASLAWEAGDRITRDRQLTATWIALAYPFPTGTPGLLLEFLGHLVLEDLNPSPPDPGLYETSVTVMYLRDAPVLVISASVDPRITAAWEDRLLASMRNLADSPPTGSFFDLSRRRFRSSVLFEISLPEERVRRVARQTAVEGAAVPDLELEIWRLRREAVAEAAAAAGPPRILLFGPESMMGR